MENPLDYEQYLADPNEERAGCVVVEASDDSDVPTFDEFKVRERERRELERQRLQVLAETEPWEVFELRAKPAKKSFVADEDLVIECVIENLTHYPLTLPSDLSSFNFTFGDRGGIVVSARSLDFISTKTAVAPGESAKFDVHFHPIGVGGAEVRLLFAKELNFYLTSGSIVGIFALPAEGRSVVILETDPGGRPELIYIPSILPSDEKLFQSNSFRLLVDASDDTELSTFDELIEDVAQWE